VLLAELVVRHTRRHMPTRRVALDEVWLPMAGSAHGASLLAAVVAEHLDALDEEQTDALLPLLDDARHGLSVPRIALRYRLQTDVHGLDRSRHRVLGEDGRLVIELDVHGAAVPQLLGAVLAVGALPPTARAAGLRAIRRAVHDGFTPAPGVLVRRVLHGHVWTPPAAGATWKRGAPPRERVWAGVPPERRWAMEVLRLAPDGGLVRDDVNRRFRVLLREAHPDHGATSAGAAERIAELTEARHVLLGFLAASAPDAAHG
jgi:hypothetical protein